MGIYEKIPFEKLNWNEFWNYNSDYYTSNL
jgi:hypothetical protein